MSRARAVFHEDNILDPFVSPEVDADAVDMFLREPRLFMESFLWVQNKDHGKMPFRLRTDQLMVYDLCQMLRAQGKPIRLIVLKARQVGISTFVEAWIFTFSRLKRDQHSLIVAHHKGTAGIILQMFQLYYEHLPDDIRPPKNRKTVSMLDMGGGTATWPAKPIDSSVEISTAKNVEFGRGYPLNMAHLTEVASYPYPEELLDGLMGGMSEGPDSVVILESTAKGMDGYFFDLWEMACDGEGVDDQQWVPVFLAWWQHDEYEVDLTADEVHHGLYAWDNLTPTERKIMDGWVKQNENDSAYGYTFDRWQKKLKWRRIMLATKFRGKEMRFNQEFPATPEDAFLAAGETVFDIEAIKFYRDTTLQNPVATGYISQDSHGNPMFIHGPDSDGETPLSIWEWPRSSERYSMGTDTAMGRQKEQKRKAPDEETPSFVPPPGPGEPHPPDHGPNGVMDQGDQPLGRLTRRARRKEEPGDYSAAEIFSVGRRQVAEYRKRIIDPIDFAEVVALLGKWYGGQDGYALVNPEANAGGGNAAGYGMLQRLVRIYPRIARWQKLDSATPVHRTGAIGWEPTLKATFDFIATSERELRRGAGMLPPEQEGQLDKNWPRLKIRSRMLLRELTSYQLKHEGEMGASRNKHDDLVRAFGLSMLGYAQLPPPPDDMDNRIVERLVRPGGPPGGRGGRLNSMPGPMQRYPWAMA